MVMFCWLVEVVISVVIALALRVRKLVAVLEARSGGRTGIGDGPTMVVESTPTSVEEATEAVVPARAVASIVAEPAREGVPVRAEVVIFTLDESGQVSLAGRQVRSLSREDGNRGLVAVDAMEFVDAWSKKHQVHVLLAVRVQEIASWFRTHEASFSFLRSRDDSVQDSVIQLVDSIASSRLARPVGAGLCPKERKLLGSDKKSSQARTKALQVATDASVRKGKAGAGIGVMAENGQWRTKYCAELRNINVAELVAIECAVRTFRGRPLEIVSDSRNAIALATGSKVSSSTQVARLVDSIRAASKGREVSYRWVPGHSGVLLNETADRLAVARRRNEDAQVDQATADRIYSNIVADVHQDESPVAA
ncbi:MULTISPECIES: ribonuclease H family protein [unclassified Dietzia]|uniref:ribonuclease H family protein n=1 Tax=unclassified Dietzia TaxID=2617939 RepID=UPI000D206FB4|nr:MULTISPECIES: ribonuclease H family protein [unclassified Dietzia]AVZ38459.1 hypothetical protein CT688_02110 [Dietzia sp. JS16-p6b]QGW23498.1 hypothetical protein GJR88_00681 [Dietzia sp. DQ12-45-1b]